ncbi:MAG: peptidylprolyl isomerase [Bacteroidia bacterium]
MKLVIITAFTFFGLFTFGQNLNEKIKHIKTADQANEFIKANPKLAGEIIELNSGTDSSEIAKKIFDNKSENSIIIEGYTYKVVETKISFLIRESYIFLSGDKLSLEQINKLRQTIISKYNSGTVFTDLAKEYNMDRNPNCDLGWLPEEMMVKEFSTAVKEHKKGEIFTIDVPDKKWYYVTLKTFNDREVKIYTILKVKSST